MSFLQTFSLNYQQPQLFNQDIRFYLSKQRIIQKNLVHMQGFDDSLYNENILISKEYLGQYGSIKKIVLVSKEDKASHKKLNSAYITFETNEQAAYCILSIDSIKINGYIIRAFFGTSKYCNHFLNNYQCLNEEKCMFLHQIANPNDIIDENTKFGYNEHIKLAKKIISFGSIESGNYVKNHSLYIPKAVFPNIKEIYDKEDNITKNKHKRNYSNISNGSTENDSSNSNNRNLSQSSSKEKDKTDNNNSKVNYNNKNCDKNCNFGCFESSKKSRFFNIFINNRKNYYDIYESKNITYIVNNLCKRMSFFIYFKKLNQIKLLKEMEINFCLNLYKKTKDNEIKLILENKF